MAGCVVVVFVGGNEAYRHQGTGHRLCRFHELLATPLLQVVAMELVWRAYPKQASVDVHWVKFFEPMAAYRRMPMLKKLQDVTPMRRIQFCHCDIPADQSVRTGDRKGVIRY